MLDPATRARIATAAGRRGGLSNIARNGARTATAPARAGFLARFEREVDPDNQLDPEERRTRAVYARKAYMADLAARSAAARRKEIA